MFRQTNEGFTISIKTFGKRSGMKTSIFTVLVVTALLTTGHAQQLSGTYELLREYGSIGSIHYKLVFGSEHKATMSTKGIDGKTVTTEVTYEVDGNDFKWSIAGKTQGTITRQENLPTGKFTVPAGQECIFVDRVGLMCKSIK
jgi:hypothetical protein